MEPILELDHICKSFGSVTALAGVSFTLRPGEVLALLGDNGAGKSTLVKILAGVHAPDSGAMRIRGRLVSPKVYNVQRARAMGIETVFQERSLGEKQPIWRNVFMGRHLTNRLGFIDVAREKKIADRILRESVGLRGLGLDASLPVGQLSGGERQGLAIGRAMYFDAQIVILDEPTTALSLKEVGKVLDYVEMIRGNGKCCLLITHNLVHAFKVADRFLILDKGCMVGTYARDTLTPELLQHKLLTAASGGEKRAYAA